MFPQTSGRDENERQQDEIDETDHIEDEEEYEPMVPTIEKGYMVFRCIFYGVLIGTLLAGMLAILQIGVLAPMSRFGVPSRGSSSFFLIYFFDNLRWCAPAVFLGLLILNAAETLLQWNYDTTRRATRAMIRNIRRINRNKSRRRKRSSREKSAQKIVEPMIDDLNLQIDDDA